MIKQSVGFKIDASVIERFNKHCKDNLLIKSRLIEKILKDFLQGTELNLIEKRGLSDEPSSW